MESEDRETCLTSVEVESLIPRKNQNLLPVGKVDIDNGSSEPTLDTPVDKYTKMTDDQFAVVPMVTMASNGNVYLEPECHTESSQTKADYEDEDEHNDDDTESRCQLFYHFQRTLKLFCEKHSTKFSNVFKFLTVLLLVVYFCYAMYYSFGDEGSITLIVLYLIVIVYYAHKFLNRILEKYGVVFTSIRDSKKWFYIRRFLYLAMAGFAITYVIIDVGLKHPQNLWSLMGMLGFIIPCILFSTSVKSINWHCIFWCLSVQFLLAVILLRTAWGVYIVEWMAGYVEAFMENGRKSSKFLFGKSSDHRLLLETLPLLFLVNAFLAILYHLGLMRIVFKCIGKLLSSTLETTPPESLSVAANLFLGGTQVTLVIKPYLNTMSVSELFTLMVGSFSSVSGAVFGIYIKFGAPAKHLLTASIMSAPASFAIAKLLVPETKPNRKNDWENTKLDISKYKNVIDATCRGSIEVVGVFTSILVNLYVFYALLDFVNAIMIWSGARIGIENLSFQLIVSYLLMPLPVFMGIDIQDCRSIAKLIGYKLVGSNSLAFIMLGKLRENKEAFLDYTLSANRTWHYKGDDIVLDSWNTTLTDGIISDRSTSIATYAMCGFSNFSSIGIMLGALYALIPKRNGILVKIVLKAMIAGNIACYLTACIADRFKDRMIGRIVYSITPIFAKHNYLAKNLDI